MGTRLFLLMSVAFAAQPFLTNAVPTGRTLTDAETNAAVGGLNGVGATTVDAECLLSAQCTLPLLNIVCTDFPTGLGCLAATEMVDNHPGDLPLGCGLDSPGEVCTLDQPYHCATIYFCYENPYTSQCEADPGNVQGHISAASICDDTSN